MTYYPSYYVPPVVKLERIMPLWEEHHNITRHRQRMADRIDKETAEYAMELRDVPLEGSPGSLQVGSRLPMVGPGNVAGASIHIPPSTE
jgi:hypothetical protein